MTQYQLTANGIVLTTGSLNDCFKYAVQLFPNLTWETIEQEKIIIEPVTQG